MQPIPAPVLTRPERLPLADPNFSWEQFQAFSRDFVCKYTGVDECHHYGKPGDIQNGIDLYVDLPNGERWAFQVRQVEKFTKRDAEKSIAATSYQADRYHFLLSCEATKAVRDVCDAHGWEALDVRDISGKVRDLDLEVARRLIETHFGPAWRKDFLGLADLSPFLTTAQFFRDLSDPQTLFNHSWQLVGRAPNLTQLHEFVSSAHERIAILPGRGGIGKSKILQELGKSRDTSGESPIVRFLVEGVSIGNNLDGLPAQESVIIVDDAHRRDDLSTLLALVRQREPRAKLILACRPHAVDRLRSTVIQNRFDSRDLVVVDELKELSKTDVTELARQSLSAERQYLAEQLAAATSDCPLITVIAGRLLSEKSLDPRLLERNQEFRDAVLSKFYEEIVGKIGGTVEPALCRSLLRVAAAIAPLRTTDETLIEAVASFIGVDRSVVIESLGMLERAGILLRRGNTVRITPDVLADHVLHNACQTAQGVKTGYAERIFETFAPVCPAAVLRNLAELDWRISQTDGAEADLLSEVWNNIEEEFKSANNAGRSQILDLLNEVAYYQPKKMMRLVEYAINHPSITPDDPQYLALGLFSHERLLQKLPPLLRGISYTLEYLPRCCDLLWELGRDDARRLNSNPDHAIRILEDLVAYDIGKPVSINHAVLQSVQRWLQDPAAHNHVHSPLHIVDPMLAKTGHSTRGDGMSVALTPFHVSRENTQHIRAEALDVISSCATSGNTRLALRAIQSLGTGLHEPIPYLTMTISAADKERWVPDQLDVIRRLRDAAESSDDPLIHLEVISQVRWTAKRGSAEHVKEAAQGLMDSIPQSFELRLTKFLIDSYDKEQMYEEGYADQWQKKEEEKLEVRTAACAEFVKLYPDSATGFDVLTGRLTAIIDAGVTPEPMLFLHALSLSNSNYAADMCERMIGAEPGSLDSFFGNLLFNLRQSDPNRTLNIIKTAFGTNQIVLHRGIAWTYGNWARLADLSDEELNVLQDLLASPDEMTKYHAIKTLAGVGRFRSRWAIDRAISVEIGNSSKLAEAICEIFDARFGIPDDNIIDADIQAVLPKLETVNEIENYHVSLFISYAAKRLPQAVVRLILARIDQYSAHHDRDYRPLPYGGLHEDLTGVIQSDDYAAILREVRDRASQKDWTGHFWLPKLFVQISDGFGPTCLEILDEWINSGDEGKIEGAASLVGDAFANFVFEHVDFVENLLNRAAAISEQCYRRVSIDLQNSANSEVRTSTVGSPAPQDISVRDQARDAASKFAFGTPAQRFYQALADDAHASIRNGLARDEEYLS
jgi:hypothetical protein